MSIDVELSYKKARGKKKILKGIFLILLGGGILWEELTLGFGFLIRTPVPVVLVTGAVLLFVGIIMIPAGMLQWWANK